MVLARPGRGYQGAATHPELPGGGAWHQPQGCCLCLIYFLCLGRWFRAALDHHHGAAQAGRGASGSPLGKPQGWGALLLEQQQQSIRWTPCSWCSLSFTVNFWGQLVLALNIKCP